MAGHVDDFGDAADGVLQHVVGMGKGLVLRDVVAQHFEQLLVEHHDQRIDIGFEFSQAVVGIGHAATAFKIEGLGHHAHRQNAHFTRHAGNHRRRAGTGATAHAGGDEQHVRAVDGGPDVVHRQFSGFAALVGLAAGAQSTAAELDALVRIAAAQGLRIGIGADELHALHATTNHVAHGVAATATDADDLDLGALVKRFFFNHFDGHFCSPSVSNILQLPKLVWIMFFCLSMRADPCIAIANAGFRERAKVWVAWLKVPHKPVLDLTESGFHGTIFLRHLETAQTRHAGFFEQAHDGGRPGLGHHVGQGA